MCTLKLTDAACANLTNKNANLGIIGVQRLVLRSYSRPMTVLGS